MVLQLMLFSFLLVLCYADFEGDPCSENGKAGTCIKIGNCPSAIESIAQTKKYPKICGFDKSDPIVCCFSDPGPTTILKPVTPTVEQPDDEDDGEIGSRFGQCQPIALTEKKTGQKALDMCIEYQEKYVYPCTKGMSILGAVSRVNNCKHNADELIIGGKAATRDEFPHMVLLRYGFDEKSKQYICGGSIISDSFVLTAAHCIAPTEELDVTHVIVGALTLKEADIKLKRYAVKNIITHPKYASPSKYHDIALIQTEKKMPLSQYVVPACLHLGDPVKDDRVLATGWGLTKNKDASSIADTLQKVILDKFHINECAAKFLPQRHLKQGVDPRTQLCYGHRNESRDTCLGDSGGPIVIKSKRIHCMYTIVGITSFGKGCGFPDSPAFYTRVSEYVPWIESVVWP